MLEDFPPTGTIPFYFEGSTYATWYSITLPQPTQVPRERKRPTVVLHGGPGLTSYGTVAHVDLAQFGIPVIQYDQIGNGRSSHAEEKPPSFWTIDLMIAELLNVLQSFGIQDNFDIIGHSWGGMMAMETVLRHGVPHGVGVPKSLPGLKHLVLVSAPANTTTSSKSVGERLATFPDWVRKGWTRGHSSPEFLEAYKVFDAVHKCRLKPQPPEHWINLNYSLKDKRLHEAFFMRENAPLKNWTIENRLSEIVVPTLVINGRYDMFQDYVVEPLFQKLPLVKWVTLGNSSHTSFWEDRERYMMLVSGFLSS